MAMSSSRNAKQSRNLLIANKCFENVAIFKYLGRTVTNRTHEEI